MTVEAPPRPPRPDELDALIEEARQRARRRRLLYGIAALLAAGATAAATLHYLNAGSNPATHPREPRQPAWVRGLHAMRIAYDAPYQGKRWVWTARGDGSDSKPLAIGSAPVLSPNGRRIVFIRHSRAPGGEVWVMTATGDRPRLIARSPWAGGLDGAWSPDSRHVVLAESRRLVLANVDGNARVLVKARPRQDIGSASFSPGSRQIVYEREDNYRFDNLFLYTIETGRIRRLTNDGGSYAPLWGPKGIAFQRSTGRRRGDRRRDIWLLDLNRGTLRRLTHIHALENVLPLAWSGNGRRLLAVTPPMHNAYLWTVDLVTGRTRMTKGLQSLGLSRNGKAILALSGCGGGYFDRRHGGNIEVLPFQGGRPRVVVSGTCGASWSG